MDQGLIDEYWINVHPVILGQGKSLLTDNKKKIAFNNLSTKRFKSGTVGLRYEPVRYPTIPAKEGTPDARDRSLNNAIGA